MTRLFLKNNSGASAVAVILLLSILTVAGIVFVSVMGTGIEQSVVEVSSMRALYAAEGGAETATGRLKKISWLWNDGYSNKALGTGTTSSSTFNAEVLEYEGRDATLPAAAYKCEAFQLVVKSLVVGANTARTVYLGLYSTSASPLGLQLYNADVTGACAAPPAGNLVDTVAASSTAKSIRYRIPEPLTPPVTYTYTARVTGTAGTAYQLRLSHPDEPAFSAGITCGAITGTPYQCQRSIISIGKVRDSRREVFQAVTK
ncbi:hypothetical protein EPN18_02145 [bacterium]|nr:MAG: hypothetical protein EPN18_02145 [bacterium]